MLRYGLVIAAVVGFLAPVARADLIFGDPIDIEGSFAGETVWGSPFEGPHPFGGETFYVEQLFFTPIVVSSGELLPPPGKKFAGQIGITYDPVYLVAPLPHREGIDISGIKDPGAKNFINSVEVVGPLADFSTVTTDGFNIHFEAYSLDILDFGGGTVTITWTQIPAPGSLALLGLAGLMGTRRRRR